VCISSKHTHTAFGRQLAQQATHVYELLHSNICGPMPSP
jgi:hypothetical protein